MLREVKTNVGWLRTEVGFFQRRSVYTFFHGKLKLHEAIPSDAYQAILAQQLQQPVGVMVVAASGRRYWMYQNRYYWDDKSLGPADVRALVFEQDRRKQRRLERAHQLYTVGDAAGPGAREAIPLELQRAVHERDDGRCRQCGSTFKLQFDHIIPVSMGGATTAANLQVLCADCNRRKGATLG